MNFNETNRLESSSTWYFCNLVAFFFFFLPWRNHRNHYSSERYRTDIVSIQIIYFAEKNITANIPW